MHLLKSFFAYISSNFDCRICKNWLDKYVTPWPERYTQSYGHAYSIVETNTTEEFDNHLKVELKYPSQEITRDMIEKMGWIQYTIPEYEFLLKQSREETSYLRIKYETGPDPSHYDEEKVADPNHDSKKSKGRIISRDIITGEECIHANCEQAAYSCEFTPAALRRTYLDKARQLKGKHWRSEGKPYWIPPNGFHFEPDNVESSTRGYVKAVDTNGNIHVYDSITAAAKILDLNRRSLSDFVDQNKVYKGFIWSFLPASEWGTWSNNISNNVTNITQEIVPETGTNGRCKGKIIARNLETGEETIYDSVTRAGALNLMSPHALTNSFIDKPRIARGKHFRSFISTQYWSPPTYFRYNPTEFESKTTGYVISIAENDENDKVMYESIKSAHELDGIQLWGIQQYLDSGKPYKGRIWNRIAPEVIDSYFKPI